MDAVRPYWVVGLESGLRWNTTNIVTYFARVCSRNLVLSDDVDLSIVQKKNKSKKSDIFVYLGLTLFIISVWLFFVIKNNKKTE